MSHLNKGDKIQSLPGSRNHDVVVGRVEGIVELFPGLTLKIAGREGRLPDDIDNRGAKLVLGRQSVQDGDFYLENTDKLVSKYRPRSPISSSSLRSSSP
jgi:hypothetical protein